MFFARQFVAENADEPQTHFFDFKLPAQILVACRLKLVAQFIFARPPRPLDKLNHQRAFAPPQNTHHLSERRSGFSFAVSRKNYNHDYLLYYHPAAEHPKFAGTSSRASRRRRGIFIYVEHRRLSLCHEFLRLVENQRITNLPRIYEFAS